MPKIIRIHMWPSLHNSPSMYFLSVFICATFFMVKLNICEHKILQAALCCFLSCKCVPLSVYTVFSLVCAKCCMFAVFSLFLCNNEIRVVTFFPSNVCLHFWITSLGKLPNGLPLTRSRHLTIFKALSTYDQAALKKRGHSLPSWLWCSYLTVSLLCLLTVDKFVKSFNRHVMNIQGG